MKNKKKYSHLTLVKAYEPAYPNAADHNYFTNRVLNIVTALVSGMGFVSAMVFLVTMV